MAKGPIEKQQGAPASDAGLEQSAQAAVAGDSSDFVSELVARYGSEVMGMLLKDKTTGENIIWADDEYQAYGEGYGTFDAVTIEKISGENAGLIKPRFAKEREHQSKRTREHAEVFTPVWLVNKMNNYMDADWFGLEDVFTEEGDKSWQPTEAPVEFPEGKTWQDYIDLTKLEITCGEAPFICSRYDSVTGETLPVRERVGFLDRKLRVVSENAADYAEWWTWALRALQSTYGYEYQGDNLLIARINVIETMAETKLEEWAQCLTDEEVQQVAHVISWNLWQMDGLKDTVPTDKPIDQKKLDRISGKDSGQMDMLDMLGMDESEEEKAQFCVIYDWREDKAQEYVSLKS